MKKKLTHFLILILSIFMILSVKTYSQNKEGGLELNDLQEYWANQYDQTRPNSLNFGFIEHEVKAKALPDGCYFGIGDDQNYYVPGGIDCETCTSLGGQPKTNQAYVWGLTKESGKLYFGTAANVHCLVMGTFLGMPIPNANDCWVCEFGESPFVPPLPPSIGDWRPARILKYDIETETHTDITPPDPLLMQITGLRSAGSMNGVALLGGPSMAGGVNIFAFNTETDEYLGSYNLLLVPGTVIPINNIRKWLVVDDVLYLGLGTLEGGSILRWSGDVNDPFQFETVGNIEGQAAELALHDGRIFVSTWPVISGFNITFTAGLWMSPEIPQGGLTNEHIDLWEKVWEATDYEPDSVTANTYGGGALVSYGGSLYWGTMHVPFVSTLYHFMAYPPATLADSLLGVLGTYRAISIFRGSNFGTPEQDVDLLYGNHYLPKYTPGTGWELVSNNMNEPPLYGPSGIWNLFNNYTWTMDIYNEQLYLGTMDWSFLLYGILGELFQDAFNFQNIKNEGMKFVNIGDFLFPEFFFGADLFRFPVPGHPAIPVSVGGVGNHKNYGIRTMLSDEDYLYLGTANPMNLSPEGGWELIELKDNISGVFCPENFSVCIDEPPFPLEGATPEGGNYSGEGVVDGIFDAALAGVGIHEITYTYTGDNGCPGFCTFEITVFPLPEVYAGEDGTICQYFPFWLDDATAENYSSLLWTTGGFGDFDFPDSLNPVYIAAPEDAGTVVTLCLTAQPIDPCTVAAVDCRDISVIGLATADAGVDASICDYETFMTNGSATNYSSTMWTTGGDGTFGNEFLLIAEYFPGPNDKANGSVELCLTAFAINPCDIDAEDCMTLTILSIPIIITNPVNVSAPWGTTVDFIIVDEFANSYQWYGPAWLIIPCATDATLTIPDITLADEGEYYCEVANECATVTSDIATLTVEPSEQIIDLPASLNGFSTYLNLVNDDIATIVAPLGANLSTLEFIDEVYIPGGVSFVWDEEKGAKAFMANPNVLSVFGYPTLGYLLNLPAGWSIMPVWNQWVVNAADVFDPLGADLIVASSLDYSGVYWPETGIFTLELLVPGCSYYIALEYPATLDFDVPIVDTIVGYQPLPANITNWNDVEMTGNQHLFAVTTDALSQLEIGDVIGAFNQYGEIAGMVEIESMNNLALRVFADNIFTSKTDGFVNGDMITFHVFRSSTGEEFDVIATFDAKMPNTNIFENEGLSMITNFKLGATSIGEIAGDFEVQLYPNPAKDLVNIIYRGEMDNHFNVKIYTSKGQLVREEIMNQNNLTIKLSGIEEGIYFLKISNEQKVVVKKLIKK